jgi:hypothetical protein
MNLSEIDPDHNGITGTVTKDGNEVFEISGEVGINVELARKENGEKITLYSEEGVPSDTITYPPVSIKSDFFTEIWCWVARRELGRELRGSWEEADRELGGSWEEADRELRGSWEEADRELGGSQMGLSISCDLEERPTVHGLVGDVEDHFGCDHR